MKSKMFNPMHPGAFITQTYVKELGLSVRAIARGLDVAPSTLSRLLNGKAGITPEMAIRLSIVLGRSPESWMKMQEIHDLWHAENTLDVSRLTPITATMA